MNKLYRISWKRTVHFSGDIVINDETDPRIYADAHARTGELAMRCHGKVTIDEAEDEVYCLEEAPKEKQWGNG